MNESKPNKDQAGQHQRERKQYFENLNNWRKEYLSAAWKDVKEEAHKGKFWLEVLAFLVLLAYTVFSGMMWWQTKNAAQAAKESAAWTGHQARDFFNDERPRMWVKIPDSIHIEAGKPIKPNICIFNYGKTPGIVSARIRFEAAQGLIEKFRDTMRYHPNEFTITEQRGTLKVLINPNEGKTFSIETADLILSKQDLEKLAAGTIDVAIFGRIFYTDLSNGAMGERNSNYKTLFCIYVTKDGTTSACPNTYDPATKFEAYTNWAQ
jgi:hypothetical protein